MAWARPRMRALQLHLEVKVRWLVVEAAAVVVITNGHRAVLVRQHPAAVERDGWQARMPVAMPRSPPAAATRVTATCDTW